MDKRIEILERFVFDKMSATKLPSLSIAIVKGANMIYSRTFGYADIESKKPADDETLYGIGSVSKSFTCLSIMKLQELGELSVDDPISKYLPIDLEVTISQLMTHSSGIPGLGYAEALIREQISPAEFWLPIAKKEDLLTFMKGVKDWHLFETGRRWFYLNEGYELLEMVVEKVSGMDFKTFVREAIFKPLGLRCSFLEDQDEMLASPYYPSEGIIKKADLPGGPMNGAGGIVCSSKDLSLYGYMYASRDGKVVSKESLLEMEKARVRIPHEIPYGDHYYGYGLMVISDFFGRKLVEHGGSVLVYTAEMLYSVEDDISIAVLANSSGYSMKNFALYALATLVDIDLEELPFVKRDKVYSKLEGEYKTYKSTIKAKVSRHGDFLKIIMFEDLKPYEVILVPEKLEENSSVFYTLISDSKLPVHFETRNGKTIMIYERYVFEKS